MSEEKHNNKNYFQNPDVLKWVIVGLVCFVLVIVAFGAGVKIGASKAKFSYRWAESYHKNFGGPRGGFLGDWQRFPAGDFISGHGAFGEIIEIKDNSFVIKGRENVEKVIITNEDTAITRGRETIKDGLNVGDRVVIIGSPNEEGQIEAKLIRIFSENDPKQLPLRSRPIPFF